MLGRVGKEGDPCRCLPSTGCYSLSRETKVAMYLCGCVQIGGGRMQKESGVLKYVKCEQDIQEKEQIGWGIRACQGWREYPCKVSPSISSQSREGRSECHLGELAWPRLSEFEKCQGGISIDNLSGLACQNSRHNEQVFLVRVVAHCGLSKH